MPGVFLRSVLVTAIVVPAMTLDVSAQPPPAWVYKAPTPPAPKAEPRSVATEVGTLSMMTEASRNRVLARLSGDTIYDLSVQYFIGLPSWYGRDDLPPIVARGVLIDVAGFKNVRVLPDAYRITREELEAVLSAQRVSLQRGDIVLIRGGKITLDAARWLAESGAMLIGGDALSLEQYEYGRPDLTVPVHSYLLTERGIAIIQVDNLERLAADGVHEFAFIAAPLRTGGVATLQFRPLAFRLHPERP